MKNFQIGAQLYSVRNFCQKPDEMKKALYALHEMGYNICQSSGVHYDNIPPVKQREMYDEVGMKCVCTHIAFDSLEKDFDRVVDDHKTLGCNYVGVGMMPTEFRKTPEAILEFAKRSEEIAAKLAEHGMYYIYHNHNCEFHRFAQTGKNAMEMMFDATKLMQFELDVFWVQAGGADPCEWIHKLDGRMHVMHLKEFNGGSRDNLSVEMGPIGTGNMNFEKICKACADTSVKYALIEDDDAANSGDSLGRMKTSIENMKKIKGDFIF